MDSTGNSDFFLSSLGTEPIENPDIPADTNDCDDIAKLDFSSEYVDPEGLGTRTRSGTDGADTFQAEALLNATSEIVAKHTNNDGTIDWKGVAGENDNYHDHWVEGPGDIVINDFGKGDKFVLRGHTAEAILLEESDNQAVIGLVSDQGRDGSRGNGAHDLDILGKATINHDGSFNFAKDVKDITNNVFDGVASTLEEFEAMGENAPDDMGEDAPDDMGEDAPDDIGEDAGNQGYFLSSLGTEPIENPDIPADTDDGDDIAKLDFSPEYVDPEGLGTTTRSGTDGADTFRAEALLNATSEIVAKHTRNNGTINWKGVAGENDNYHDHWVEGPGDIVINDFGKGDKFILRGHTAEAILLEESDNQAVIGLVSDQGRDGSRGNGAHDLDILGKATINHDGNFNFAKDVKDITNNVFDGVASTLKEFEAMGENAGNQGYFLSSLGTEPIENPDIPADTDDGDDIAKLDFSPEYVDPEGLGTTTRSGTDGADTFRAEALLNATSEIVAKHTRNNGTINWKGVAGENDNYHDHWVEGPGDIVINDFGKGDKFILRGHTAEAILLEESDNQAVIGLISDQGNDGSRGNGAHDLDILGKATINHDGSFNFAKDVKDITNNVFDGVASTLKEFEAMGENAGNQGYFLSSLGTEPIENPDIPADTDDGDDIAKLDFSPEYVDPEGLGTTTRSGTDGADTFRAEALLNATSEIVAKHTRNNGTINWKGVAGENDNYHDHWVEGPGDIVINDFGKGDKFILRGHTAEAILLEESDNQAVIGLVSDQGRDGSRGNGAHDLDILGKATINHDGNFNFAKDVKDITNNVFDGVASTLKEFEAMGENAPDDTGEDAGNKDFLLRSLGTEPIENPDIPADTDDGDDIAKLDFSSEFVDPEGLGTRTRSGTDGADTFRAEALLNATPEIIAKHTNSDGSVNWKDVAGENDNYHDHWVEGPGDIVINNFGKGDKFVLRGHTAEAILLEESDNQAVIGLISDQGRDGSRGTGAHDLDVLGKATINHDGSFNFAQDVTDITNNVFDGVI